MDREEIIKRFSEMVLEKFKDMVKYIVVFGSYAKGEESPRDIDFLIIIDDTVIPWTSQAFTMVFNEIGGILEKFEEREKIHPNVLVLSAFINNVLKGEPITLNIVRYGTAIYDSGIFLSIKRLLRTGLIKPSIESMVSSLKRAYLSIGRARWKLLMAMVDIYWAMILSAEALLMKNGVSPGDPQEVPDQLSDIIEEKYRDWLKEIYDIQKNIAKFEKKDVSLQELDEWMKRAEEFLNVVDRKIKETGKTR